VRPTNSGDCLTGIAARQLNRDRSLRQARSRSTAGGPNGYKGLISLRSGRHQEPRLVCAGRRPNHGPARRARVALTPFGDIVIETGQRNEERKGGLANWVPLKCKCYLKYRYFGPNLRRDLPCNVPQGVPIKASAPRPVGISVAEVECHVVMKATTLHLQQGFRASEIGQSFANMPAVAPCGI
jgi:hypothetical protein